MSLYTSGLISGQQLKENKVFKEAPIAQRGEEQNDDSNEYKIKYSNCHVCMPQPEQGGQQGSQWLDSKYVTKCKLTRSDLELCKTSSQKTSHGGLTTVFMSIWLSLTCTEMGGILNTWQITVSRGCFLSCFWFSGLVSVVIGCKSSSCQKTQVCYLYIKYKCLLSVNIIFLNTISSCTCAWTTDGDKLISCCGCVSRFEIRQDLSQSRQRCGIGPSSCQPAQLSKHMGEAAPDGGFKAKHHKPRRRIHNILEVTAGLVVELTQCAGIIKYHWVTVVTLRQKSSFPFHSLMRWCHTEMMLMYFLL